MCNLCSALKVCALPIGATYLPHSEIMRLYYDEGYVVEPAQGMAYDSDNVQTYDARIDTFHTDWFDAAELSQTMRAAAPPAVPASFDDDKSDEEIPREDDSNPE